MNDLIKRIYDCEKEGTAVGIANGLFWAFIILATSWLLAGSEYANAFFIIIIVGATSSMLYIDSRRKNK